MKELSDKAKSFCEEYVKNGYNWTKAYQAAYGMEDPTKAAVWASQLLRDIRVKDEIDNVETSFKVIWYQEWIDKREIVKRIKAAMYAERRDKSVDWTSVLNAIKLFTQLTWDITENKKIEIEETAKVKNLDEMTKEEREEYHKKLLAEL